jgi:prepilin-type N-terminal cleavage/methylation domain-containing protein
MLVRSLTTQRAAQGTRTARRGFTLGELVVALLLFSMVAGGVLTLVMRQQRFYRSTADIMKLQGQLRQGASLLPVDLRTVSTSDTLVNGIVDGIDTKYNADIYARNDWSIEFRRTFGSSLICAKRTKTGQPRDTIRLLPKATDSVDALTSWGIPPIAGDSILLLDDWTTVGPGDDRWRAFEIMEITPVTGNDGCPWKGKVAGDNTPLLWATDVDRESYKITLSDTLRSTVIVGAPVRIFRRVRYEIYQAGDQQWYLGYSDCLPSYESWNKCSEVTPVSGPYRAYTGIPSQNGLAFAYFDSLGNPLDDAKDSRHVARVEVIMRSVTDRLITRTGSGPGQQYSDSVVLSIGIRNRR